MIWKFITISPLQVDVLKISMELKTSMETRIDIQCVNKGPTGIILEWTFYNITTSDSCIEDI